MAKNQYGLGKGLGALLGGDDLSELRKPVGYINKEVVSAEGKPQDTSDVLRIPVGLIEPNPYQPRMSFASEAMQELSDSIRTFGLIQPITVRRKGEK
jgi:ParB family chromosome partitioning protein